MRAALTPPSMLIGIDFDNTLAGYDRAFAAEAARRGLIPLGDRPPSARSATGCAGCRTANGSGWRSRDRSTAPAWARPS